jgi:hypothetical protein
VSLVRRRLLWDDKEFAICPNRAYVSNTAGIQLEDAAAAEIDSADRAAARYFQGAAAVERGEAAGTRDLVAAL